MDRILESTRNLATTVKFKTLNTVSFDGSTDVIVVREKSGKLSSTPFHVRFGRLTGTIIPADRVVNIEVNGRIVLDVTMRLDDDGIAYFNKAPEQTDQSENKLPIEEPSETNKLVAYKSLPDLDTQNEKDSNTNEQQQLKSSNSSPQFSSANLFSESDYIRAADAFNNFLQHEDKPNSKPSKVTFLRKNSHIVLENNKSRAEKQSVEDEKSTRISLTSAELEKLELLPGANEIRYFIKNSTKKCLYAYIYLW
jgi:phosphatidate phosphatase PAH1